MKAAVLITILLPLAGCEKSKPDPVPKTADQIDPAKNPWNADKRAGSGSAAAVDAGTPSTPPDDHAHATKIEKPPVDLPADGVRPPVVADLAEYTKSLPGKGTKLLAKIETSMGVINCELFPDKAPMTVANFVGLATGKKQWKNPKTDAVEKDKPFYDGLMFHRVIPEFMIQGGDPLGTGTSGPGYQFGDEVQNGLVMGPGTLAMANAGPSTNGSQFFITEGAPEWLNGKHTIFGKCTELELVKKIARVPQDAQNKPDTPVTMKIAIKKG